MTAIKAIAVLFTLSLAYAAPISAAPPGGAGGAGDPGDNTCAEPSDREQVACLDREVAAADQRLDGLYQAALSALPVDDPSDRRRDRAHLVKAQAAWKAFADANCQYVGAAEGGSNLWVTNFASRCLLDETRRRIAFFQHQAARRNQTGRAPQIMNVPPAATARSGPNRAPGV